MVRVGTVRAWTAGLDDIERWFVARGLPHFVERHDSVWEIWGRAAPLLVAPTCCSASTPSTCRSGALTENLVAGAVVVGAAVI